MKELIEILDRALPTLGEEAGFTLLGPGAERHGVLEWTFGKTDELNRFLTVACHRLPSSNGPLYGIEVWIGADDGQRYLRRLAQEFQMGQAELRRVDGILPPQFTDVFSRAAKAARQINKSHLIESYALPASPART